MSGTVLGDFLLVMGADVDPAAFERALRQYPLPGTAGAWIFRRLGPGLCLLFQGDVLLSEGEGGCGGAGLYQFLPGRGESTPQAERFQAEVVRNWREGISPTPRGVSGRFCTISWNLPARRIVGCTDPFRTTPLYYTALAGRVACATDLRLLLAPGLAEGKIDPHALYHYLNFGYVPTPFSILQGVHKVPPGCAWVGWEGGASVTAYWDPQYPEDLSGDEAELARALRDVVEATVLRYRPDADRSWGTFLSGGTDSSSIAGILSRGDPKRHVSTFSIGFEEAPKDELRFVKIAASHFGLRSHEKILKASEALAVIPRLLEGFDEPFGNPGAIPAYICAAHARDCGVEILLAGDGGDEIFGGNEWYKKNRILGWYYGMPGPLKGLAAALLRSLNGVDASRLERARNFVRRGVLPNPDRLYAGDSFASQCFENLLSGDFQALVRAGESLELVRETYARVATRSELHRLMYFDLKRTIADSDIVKVGRTSRMAGIAVAYPYLDPALVDYMGRLPAEYKLRGLEKRYLFKKAMHNLLPREISGKRKQGFDLPMAVWLRREPSFQELFRESLLSQRARERGYLNPAYIRKLIDQHQEGSWDHSAPLFWILMLELWHRGYVDRR